MATLVSATCLTEEDIRLRKLIVQYLHEIFVEVFPECEVVPFGSSSTELGLNGADLDLCLLVDPVSLENATLEGCEDTSCLNDVTDQLTFIVKLLRQFAAGFQNVVAVVSAKCPLVKFLHRDSGLSCDLSINNRYLELIYVTHQPGSNGFRKVSQTSRKMNPHCPIPSPAS